MKLFVILISVKNVKMANAHQDVTVVHLAVMELVYPNAILANAKFAEIINVFTDVNLV